LMGGGGGGVLPKKRRRILSQVFEQWLGGSGNRIPTGFAVGDGGGSR